LSGEFFRWEFATAVAGSLLGVNPFDQPDVEAAKIATRALTQSYERGERFPIGESDSGGDLAGLLDSIRPGDYFAILAFLPMFPEVREALGRIRAHVRRAKRVATSVGFGPRFLHSTGQAFKGGPNTGVYLQLTCSAEHDVAIPNSTLTFGAVVSAQAAGDRSVLRERGRRLVHLHLKGDLGVALAKVEAAVETAVGG
jgi:transaldolase/glucose-6-phosphate isomerase